jgi:catechol 2,3-dioxygenase-like lactoylglutathione lyase family enzyme
MRRLRSAAPGYGSVVTRLGHVILFVSDLEASVRFYRDEAGLPHRFTEAGYAEFGTGSTRLAVYERRRAEWLTGHPVHPGPAGEIVLVVDDGCPVPDRPRGRSPRASCHGPLGRRPATLAAIPPPCGDARGDLSAAAEHLAAD